MQQNASCMHRTSICTAKTPQVTANSGSLALCQSRASCSHVLDLMRICTGKEGFDLHSQHSVNDSTCLLLSWVPPSHKSSKHCQLTSSTCFVVCTGQEAFELHNMDTVNDSNDSTYLLLSSLSVQAQTAVKHCQLLSSTCL